MPREDRSCTLRRAPSRRDFDVLAFYGTVYSIGKCFKSIRNVLKFDLMCDSIAIPAHAPSDGLFAAHEALSVLRVSLIVLYMIDQVY